MKGVLKRKEGFDSIPLSVIVNEILSFFAFKIDKNPENKYLLFGYFRNDRRRQLWFLFRSICVNFGSSILGGQKFEPVNSHFHVDFSKLLSLEVFFQSVYKEQRKIEREFVSTVICESAKPSTLISLRINSWTFSGKDGMFFSGDSFPNLETLVFRSDIYFGNNWHELKNPFCNLKSLEMYSEKCFPFNNCDFFTSDPNRFANIQKLDLTNISLEEETRVKFPQLEELTLFPCENLYIIPGDKLKKFSAIQLHAKYSKVVYDNSPNLHELKICQSETNSEGFIFNQLGFTNNWFLNSTTTTSSSSSSLSSEKLKKVELSSIIWNEEILRKWYLHRNQFEEISLFGAGFGSGLFFMKNSSRIFIDLFDNKSYKSLKTLVLESSVRNISSGDCKWRCSKNIENLKLIGYITDDLFRKNEWKNLRSLTLKAEKCRTDDCTGSKWKRFPKIQKIKFSSLNHFRDDFFRSHRFPHCFEHLVIKHKLYEYYTPPNGRNWHSSFFKYVKKIKVKNSKFAIDVLLGDPKNGEFMSLEKLSLIGMDQVTGKGWKNLKNLKCIKVENCRNVFEGKGEKSKVLVGMKKNGVIIKFKEAVGLWC